MKNYSLWVCFISQTGSEVIRIAAEIGRVPDIVITNNPKKLSKETKEFFEETDVFVINFPFNPSLEDYNSIRLTEDTLFTLHGYLRILPAEFCKKYEGQIFNGHPGLISDYPELKGKDPQERVLDKEKYPVIGSVIHEVTAELDAGKIIWSEDVLNTTSSTEDAYLDLKETSFECWREFFKNHVKLD